MKFGSSRRTCTQSPPEERAFRTDRCDGLNPHSYFETLSPNLWIIAIINLHAGVKVMKTLWRLVPNR